MTTNRPVENDTGQDENSELVGERVRIFRRGDKWWANFQHNGRQHRKSLKTHSKKEAIRKAIQLDASLSEGRYEDQVRAATIQTAADEYQAYQLAEGRAPKTLYKITKTVERLLQLAEQRKCRSLLEITPRLVDAYRSGRVTEGAAPKTVCNETVIIRQLVNWALSRHLIGTDPLRGYKIRKPKPTTQPCWKRDEVENILKLAKRYRYWAVLTTLALTGMRVGELRHLTWADVDFDNGQHGFLHIRPKEGWKPKTGDQRSIPMNARLRKILEAMPRVSEWVFVAKPSRTHPVEGRQIDDRRLLNHLKGLLRRLGLKGHVHTFRHAFISDALIRGTPVPTVRKWVGHVSPDTIDLYTHIGDEDSQAAMQRLEKSEELDLQQGKEAGNGHEHRGEKAVQIQHSSGSRSKAAGAKQKRAPS